MTYPLVRDLAAEGIPVVVACGVLGFSTQAYYRWLARPVSQRDWDDAHLINAIVDIHADDPEFGYRLIADELDRVGHRAGEHRVARLCAQQRIWSTVTRKGRRDAGKRPGPAVHDDLVQRQFTADRLDQTWLTDITEHPTGEGKAVRLRGQRRLLEPDRGLCDRRAYDRPACGGRAQDRDRPSRTGRGRDRAL